MNTAPPPTQVGNVAGIQRNTGCSMNGVTARRIRAKSGRVVIIMGSCPGSSHRRPPLSQSRHPSGANPARESGTSIRHSDCPSLFNAGSSSQLARPRRAPPCAPLPTQRHFGRSASWPPLGRKLKGIELYNAYVCDDTGKSSLSGGELTAVRRRRICIISLRKRLRFHVCMYVTARLVRRHRKRSLPQPAWARKPAPRLDSR
jgi:hypothetical protein